MKRSKFLIVLLVLLLLFGCAPANKPNDISDNNSTDTLEGGAYCLNELKNYKVREKNSNLADNEEFDAFLDTIFDELVSDSYLYMHFNVSDYKAMGIEKPEVSLGHIEYGVDNDELNKTSKQFDSLLNFDYDTLSLRQQYDYDLLHYSLLESLAGLYYSKYTLLFSSSNQFSDNLIVNLVEFPIYDEESEEDFLTILNLVPSYIDEAIAYTKLQCDDGLYHSDDMLDDEISYIDTLIDSNGTSISEQFKEYDIYSEVKTIVEDKIIPAFSNLKDYLKTLYGKTTSEALALVNIDKDYAEYTYLVNTSNNKDIDTLYNELLDVYYDWIYDFVDVYQNDNTVLDAYDAFLSEEQEPFNLDSEDMLEYLRNNSGERYEYLSDTSYVVSKLDTLGNTTLGYYVSPPIDNMNQNVIRLNAKIDSDSFDKMSVFEVLAHEGFPGHLYQNIFFQQTNPHKFRTTQSFVGYSEGYADMAAMDAIDMLDIDDRFKTIAKLNSTTFNSHFLYSIIDLGVNYYGWDVDTLGDKLDSLMIDSSYAQVLYDAVVSMPGIFVRYGVGYVSHLTLRNKAIDALGDKFDYVLYDKAIVEKGPLPFAILEGLVEDYIDENK